MNKSTRLYWLRSKAGKIRNTPRVAESAAQAKREAKRPKNPVVYRSRRPTSAERRAIRAGRWITSLPPGHRRKGRGYGPRPKKR